MSMPALMHFGAAQVITPDGSHAIASGLWPEFAALTLLEPEPEILSAWTRRLEAKLGVDDRHRRELARFDLLSFPGEVVAPTGHALTELPEQEDEDAPLPRRLSGLQPLDEHLEWYLVRAATRREQDAETALVEAGFAVYLPRLTRWARRGRYMKRRVEQPAFAGYLFVGLSSEGEISDVEAIEYVHAVVRFTAERFAVPMSFRGSGADGISIASTLQAELDGEFDRTRRARRNDPEPGAPVQIVGGSFKGFPATFVERREDERIEVLFSLFGRQSPLVLEPSQVGGLAAEDEE